MCLVILPAFTSVYHMYKRPWWQEESFGFSRTGVIDNWESPCQCWELNPRFAGRVTNVLNR